MCAIPRIFAFCDLFSGHYFVTMNTMKVEKRGGNYEQFDK